MSYDTKIKSAQDIITEHNSNVEDSEQIDFDKFMDKLRKAGGTSGDALKACSWEDIQDCGVPRLIARRIAHIFRQSNGDSGKSGYISFKKAETLTAVELLERYNPREPKSSVAKRLKELSDGKAFIVFEGSTIDFETSKRLLEDLQEGLPSVATTFVKGIPTPVYRVGERPDNYRDENPIYPGHLLRSGQTCGQTGRSWDEVSIEVRQLLWLAVAQTGELSINSLDDANDAMDKAVRDNASSFIRQRYPKASLKYDELSKTNGLPSLKLLVNKQRSSNDPFYSNRTT